MRNQITFTAGFLVLMMPSFAAANELFVARQNAYEKQESHLFQEKGRWVCASEVHDRFKARNGDEVWAKANSLPTEGTRPACDDEMVVRVKPDGASALDHRYCTHEASALDFLNLLAKACGR